MLSKVFVTILIIIPATLSIIIVPTSNINTTDFSTTQQKLNSIHTKDPVQRNQILLGCWVYVYEKINNGIKNQKEATLSIQANHLSLFKNCIEKIKRKDAVLKITSLAGKNYQEVVSLEAIVGYSIDLNSMQSLPASQQLSGYDEYLLKKAQQFEKELRQMFSKGQIKDQVEQELTKRSTLLFGIFPVSALTHSIVMMMMVISTMCICTWCKYFKNTQNQRKQRRIKKRKQKYGARKAQKEY